MKVEQNSKHLLAITQSKGKMYEYEVPPKYHIDIPRDPSRLFSLSIGLLGDVAARIGSSDEFELNSILSDLGELSFAAYFFDAYIQSKLHPEIDPYLRLLCAASYYLCRLPGSSNVMSMSGKREELRDDVGGLDIALKYILTSEFGSKCNESLQYSQIANRILILANNYFFLGSDRHHLEMELKNLRELAYVNGTPRELLLADLIAAIVRFRIMNSVWNILPASTGIDLSIWRPVLSSAKFIRELWPSQLLLAENKVFTGQSSVIQMPTSTGKTKSVEIILRSTFLREQTHLAVIIAPFKALCHEIKNDLRGSLSDENISVTELSDVFQSDFDANKILMANKKQIIVVTPEKLVYVLRQNPEIGRKIGIVIFDEGHQFDSGQRGVTYELLITALKQLLPETTQKVLISAVLPNADAINDWLNGESGVVVKGEGLHPTYRTVGFASWNTVRGRIQYVNHPNIDDELFYVPRVIESQELPKKGRERKTRLFPTKAEGSSVAIFLGLKLVKNGSVAIFCGLKTTAAKVCDQLLDIHSRGVSTDSPFRCSDEVEMGRVAKLFEENLGSDSPEARCTTLGILSHHGGIPHGLRLCVEHSMRNGSANFVVCTSTLAQGVNLPIRYLIFTSIYQAGEKIKVRDFHNLIGRSGRAGMHTEGSILFADPEVYDNRRSFRKNWMWREIRYLMEPKNSEPCASSLLSIFEKIRNKKKDMLLELNLISIFESYLNDPTTLETTIQEIVTKFGSSGFDEAVITKQFSYKIGILLNIQSYLIATVEISKNEVNESQAEDLSKSTLAYHLASDDMKVHLVNLFKLVAKSIEDLKNNSARKKAFGRTLLGLPELKIIEQWLVDNKDEIVRNSDDESALFNCLLPLIDELIQNSDYNKCYPKRARFNMANDWISGKPFFEILANLQSKSAYLKDGKQKRQIKIQTVVEMCERGFAYDGMLILGAIGELLENMPTTTNEDDFQILFSDTTVPDVIRKIQKRVKYGLMKTTEIALYEIGFSDRVVTQKLAQRFPDHLGYVDVSRALKGKPDDFRVLLDPLPTYFNEVFNMLSK